VVHNNTRKDENFNNNNHQSSMRPTAPLLFPQKQDNNMYASPPHSSSSSSRSKKSPQLLSTVKDKTVEEQSSKPPLQHPLLGEHLGDPYQPNIITKAGGAFSSLSAEEEGRQGGGADARCAAAGRGVRSWSLGGERLQSSNQTASAVLLAAAQHIGPLPQYI